MPDGLGLTPNRSEGSRTPEPNQKGTVLGGPNWKIEGKWAENDKNQSIFEGQGGPGPPTSGVPA